MTGDQSGIGIRETQYSICNVFEISPPVFTVHTYSTNNPSCAFRDSCVGLGIYCRVRLNIDFKMERALVRLGSDRAFADEFRKGDGSRQQNRLIVRLRLRR
jgi:hypothetical protein